MDEVFKFVETFKESPPRSFPPSFVPATIMEETINPAQGCAKGGAEIAPLCRLRLAALPRKVAARNDIDPDAGVGHAGHRGRNE